MMHDQGLLEATRRELNPDSIGTFIPDHPEQTETSTLRHAFFDTADEGLTRFGLEKIIKMSSRTGPSMRAEKKRARVVGYSYGQDTSRERW
jgi:hypothetical protein